MSGRKPIIGLLGAVGSGKTTVALEFGRVGCGVISADQLNHEILARPEIIEELRELFGERIIGPEGGIDREVLGDIVFSDEKELKKLTNLLHPKIKQLEKELIKVYEGKSEIKAVVLDIPLLLEVGEAKKCDFLVFVDSQESLRVERLGQKRGWGQEKIKKIENLQIGLDKKAKISEYNVCNNSSIPEIAKQVAEVFSSILERKRD